MATIKRFEDISRREFDDLYRLAELIKRLIGGLMKYLQSTTIRGPKFKRVARMRRTGNRKPETGNGRGRNR